MRKLKKAIIGILASAMLMGAMTGCGKAASDDITVIPVRMVPVQEVHSSSCSVSKRRMQTETKSIRQSQLQISQTQHLL